MKSHYFAYVACSDDTRRGGPNAKYPWSAPCVPRAYHFSYLFKCKSEEDANAVAFAVSEYLRLLHHVVFVFKNLKKSLFEYHQ